MEIKTLEINFISNEADILRIVKQDGNFEKLIVNKCPTTLEAYKVINDPAFKSAFSSNKNAVAVILKIDEKLNEEEANLVQSLSFNESRPLLIAFESNFDGKLIVYWKTESMKELLKVILDDIIDENNRISVPSNILIDSFLLRSIKFNHNGLSSSDDVSKYSNSTVPLRSLYDSAGFNLLMISAKENDENAVDYFLTTDIDVNYYFVKPPDSSEEESEETCYSMRKIWYELKKESASEIAYKNNNSSILLKLLKNDSFFPENFKHKSHSDELFKFCEEIFNFHGHIKKGDLEMCEKYIKKYPNLHYFFNTRNFSAASTALKTKNIETYELLAKNSIHFAPFEILWHLLPLSKDPMTKQIRDIHEKYALKLHGSELFSLLSRTEPSLDNTKHLVDALAHIESAYRYLLDIPEIKILLQLFAANSNAFIYPDFNRDNVMFQRVLCNGDGTSGTFDYRTHTICFGVKDISNEIVKFIIYGVIGHEFCHHGVQIVFANDCKPYSFGDVKAEKEYEEILIKCEKNKEKEEIIGDIFKCYRANKWAEELIVRVPHMIATYRNDPVKLDYCRREFKDLFEFYESHVLPKMLEALPFINTLSKKSIHIKMTDLPTSLKVTCMNRKSFKFQGVDVSLNDMFKDKDCSFFNFLPSQTIRSLIKNEPINIGKDSEKVDLYVERDLTMKTAKLIEKWNAELDQPETIYNETKTAENMTEKLVLLSDDAGTGKTTSFKYLANKFKENHSDYWILYVDLKKYLKVYEEMKDKSIEAFDVLINIQNLEECWSKKIFEELYACGRVIVFWDGLDEISPNYKEFMTEVVNSLNKSSNQQWISSRPQHIEHLERQFLRSSFKLVPYSIQDRRIYFRKYFAEKKWEESKIDELITKIEDFITSIEESENVNNPLMLKMIADICSEITFDFTKLSDWFSIFNLFIKSKFSIVREKGKIVQEEADKVSMESTFKRLHQKFALKLLFGDIFDKNNQRYPVSSPRIMKMKSKMSFEEISRFGILHIVDDDNFNFIHRSFAEYFVAEFIVESVFNLDEGAKDEINVGHLKMLFHIIFDPNSKFNIVKMFIEGLVHSNEDSDEDSLAFDLIQEYFKDISVEFLTHIIKGDFSKISFVSNFFAENKDVLNYIWNIQDNESYFMKFAKIYENSKRIQELKIIYEKYFPENVLKIVFYGIYQRGNILFNLWLQRVQLYDSNSNVDPNYFYKSDDLTDEIRLQETFLDFFNLIEKHLTEPELKELFLRNSSSIFSRNPENLKDLQETWMKMEKYLSTEEIRKILQTLDSNTNILAESLQIWNESCASFILEKYKMYLSKKEIKNFLFKFEKLWDKSTMHIAIENPNEKVLKEYWEFVFENDFTEEEQRRLLKNPDLSKTHRLILSISKQNEKTFEIVKSHAQRLYTEDKMREILWAQRHDLISQILTYSSTDVCLAALKFISDLFLNQSEKLAAFVSAYSENKENFYLYQVHRRFKLSMIENSFNATFENVKSEKWLYMAEKFNSDQLTCLKSSYLLFDELLNGKKCLFASEERYEKTLKLHQNVAIKLLLNNTEHSIQGLDDVAEEEIKIFNFLSPDTLIFINDVSAHFFLAKYFIDNIYNAQFKVLDSDVELLIKVGKYRNFELTYELILNYIENEKEKKKFHESFNILMKTKFRMVLFSDFDVAYLISNFVAKDHEMLRMLSNMDMDRTLFTVLFLNTINYTLVIDTLIFISARFFNSEDVAKIFRGRNQSRLLVYKIWLDFKINPNQNDSYIQNVKYLELALPELSSKVHELRECKGDEEITSFIERNLSPFTPNELIWKNLQRLIHCMYDDPDEYGKFLSYARVNFKENLKQELFNNARDICTSAIRKGDEFLKNLIENYELCFDEAEVKNIFTKDSKMVQELIICSFALYSNEKCFEIFWSFIEKFFKTKDEQKLLLRKTAKNPKTPLIYSIFNNDLKVFSLMKKIYLKILETEEIQEIVLTWNQSNIIPQPILFFLLANDKFDLEFFKELVEFLSHIFENNEEGLKSFLLFKLPNGNTIFHFYRMKKDEEKLKLFLPIVKNSLAFLRKC